MFLARAPLRISIAGGGTDQASYYEKFGGSWISAAIDQYIFVGINRTFTKDYAIRYSSSERVSSIDEIKHNAIREILKIHEMPPVEIVSLADIPAGTGLGSSGTFTVGFLRAIYAFKRMNVTPHALAEEAYNIERWILNQPTGKQDQFISAYGGLTSFEVDKSGNVKAFPIRLSTRALRNFEENLLMFFTGYSRASSEILSDQKTRSESGDKDMIENLHFIRELGEKIRDALAAEDLRKFGEYMHQHWLRKRERSNGMSNPKIDGWYDLAMKNGAVGGKLVGAGGGGFLLFYSEEPDRLRRTMEAAGLEEVRFNLDFDGPTVVMRD